MATRSFIAVLDNDTIKGVYCHWDGYPEHNGRILNENYTKEDALKLLEFGQMSVLGETVEQCEFYHRDRGEELSSAETYSNIAELLEAAHDAWAEYVYLFDGQWMVHNGSKWAPVIKVLDNE